MQGQIVYQETLGGGKQLIARYPKKSDAVKMRAYINALSKEKTYVLMQGVQMSLAAEREFLRTALENIDLGREVMLLLFLDAELIGISSVNQKLHAQMPQGDFGISIAKKYRGRGYGKLLMELVCAEAEEQLPIQSIVLACFANNEAGCALYTKMGFSEVGRLQNALEHKGKLVDEVIFQRLVQR